FPVDPSANFTADHQNAFSQLLRQAVDLTASRCKELFGTEVVFSLQTSTETLPSSRFSAITLSGPTLPEFTLQLYLTPEFSESLSVVPSQSVSPSSSEALSPEKFIAPGNLDL